MRKLVDLLCYPTLDCQKPEFSASITAAGWLRRRDFGCRPGRCVRGPRPDFPLEAWTHAMLTLCTSTLEAPFTRDEKRGEPISAAACFCVDAFAVLSPTTKSTLVLTAMKDAITEQGKTLEELNAKLD